MMLPYRTLSINLGCRFAVAPRPDQHRQCSYTLLSESKLETRGLFNPSAVHLLVEEQRSGRQDWSAQSVAVLDS